LALSTFDELKASIADWLNRDDLTSQIPDFITLCEATMQRLLTTMDMEASTTLATVSGTPTVALPTGFTGVRRLRVFYDAIWHDVQNVSLEPSLWDGVTNTRPTVYSIVGNNFSFRPIPNGDYALSLDYWAKFTPLSDANTSNWILTSNPDAYLMGSLLASAPFLGGDARMPMWRDGFMEAIDQINSENVTTQFGQTKLRPDPGLASRRGLNIYTGRPW
jgi:hypothetical protein